jgi:hypothetical protein
MKDEVSSGKGLIPNELISIKDVNKVISRP